MCVSFTAVKGPAEVQSCKGSIRSCGAGVGCCTALRSGGRLFTTVNTGSCQNTQRTAAAPHQERGALPPLSTLPSSPSSTSGIRPWRCLPEHLRSLSGLIIGVTQSFSFNLCAAPAGNLPQEDGEGGCPWKGGTMAQTAPPAASCPCQDWSKQLTDAFAFPLLLRPSLLRPAGEGVPAFSTTAPSA